MRAALALLLVASAAAAQQPPPPRPPTDTLRTPRPTPARADSLRADSLRTDSLRADSLRADSARAEPLTFTLDARLESKAERSRDETCSSNAAANLSATCRTFFQPNFDFQFAVRSAGTIADRLRVDVDYDSQREFDASNRIAISYTGREGQFLERVDVGNVTFVPPPSRFITAGIPIGNYGVQATGRAGPWTVQAIAAQQRGNVVAERRFTVGERSLQQAEREIEDYEIEPRRFFFTVDPATLGAAYPNIDILDPAQMAAARAALPPDRRPVRVLVYRQIIGGRPPNPNGPRFVLNGRPTSRPGPPYELLRENVDYYMDPSRLWLALVRPLGLYDERLVVAYTVGSAGDERVIPAIGGTPDVEYEERPQVANLVWEPRLEPDDPVFRQEIRSVYRVGGPDVQRATVAVAITTWAGGDQEKPVSGGAQTYLQHFGLAQRTNPGTFDVENRLWPRPADPNVVIGGGAWAPIIRDNFIVFPSLQPFARAGLAGPGNPANDTLYRIPGEYVYSAQHPAPAYRIRVAYSTEAGVAGSLALGAVQIRAGSERVTMDGRLLRRGLDYEVDYDLGVLRFLHPEALLTQPRDIRVRYEENPLFASVPTSVVGLTSQVELSAGRLAFTAIAQQQRTTYNRPPLGYEAAASVVAGLSGAFAWEAEPITRFLDGLPWVRAAGASRVTVSGELATSRPQPGRTGQAYLESFEGDGGLQPQLLESRWYFGATPASSPALDAAGGAGTFTRERAAALAWQNNGRLADGGLVRFTIQDIDPRARTVGGGVPIPEQMLWLTLHPLAVGGQFRDGRLDDPRWRVPNAPDGRRWRSLHTALGPTGADLTRAEAIEFWTLVDADIGARDANPTLVIDLGDLSENSVAFSPDTLRVNVAFDGTADTTYRGKRAQGLDSLDTELDPFSRTFNRARDDVGLSGDVAQRLTIDGPGGVRDSTDVAICARGTEQVFRLGDTRANCTVANNRADTEDLDEDGVLDLDGAAASSERLRRYVIPLGDPALRVRVGRCGVVLEPPGGPIAPRSRCWVQVRVPFRAPTDSLNGGPPLRRVQALRVTMISGETTPDGVRLQLPIARLRLVGSPWLKRAERTGRGIAGDVQGLGDVTATVIGTQDRDSLAGIFYESPPGVTDEPDQIQTGLEAGRTQVNERALRLLATRLAPLERAEAYVRFPEGDKSFLGYRRLRLWARGRGPGWGTDGALHFYVKVGRDADNFYLYRTPVNEGPGVAAWSPEVRVDLQRFSRLRGRLQQLSLERPNGAIACTGIDSALVAATPVPAGSGPRYAACDDGYVAYSLNPAVSPPNLAAVQELAVGMVRLPEAAGRIEPLPGDTLELWVNDLRLDRIEDTPGYAGQLAVALTAGDVADVALSVTRRDPFFRQLAEQPGFRTDDAVEAAITLRVDRMLPASLNLDLPVTVRHTLASTDPYYVTGADYDASGIVGLRTPRARATTVAATVRRARPRGDLLLDHLALSAALSDASTRGEFQRGTARDARASLEYRLASPARTTALPPWIDDVIGRLPGWLERSAGVRALRDATLRWNPAEVRVTTGIVRARDDRLTFLRLAPTAGDVGSPVGAESFLWRTGGALAVQPFGGLGGRVELATVRDLRSYGDTTAGGIAIERASGSLLGTDAGFERERTLNAALTLAPPIAAWLRPRLELRARFDLLRDPNRRPLLVNAEGETLEPPGALGFLDSLALDSLARDPFAVDPRTGLTYAQALRLPRRLGNERTSVAGVQLDLARLARTYLDTTRTPVGWLVRAVLPLDVTFTRSLRSAYDALPFTPGWGYQFGVGGTGDYRNLGGRPAATAGEGTQLVATQSVRLPAGIVVAARLSRNAARTWTRQPFADDVDGQREDAGSQVGFPDVTVRWNHQDAAEDAVVTNVGLSARMLHTRQENVALADRGPLSETRTTRLRTYPVSGAVTWAFGGLTTSGGYTLSLRTDTIPGTVINSVTRDASADVGRPFALPPQWNLRSDLRTRISYQYSRTRSTAASLDVAERASRLLGNGRWALSLNADTDVAENLTFVLQGARIVTFDENLGRRFTQTVLTTALQLQFYSGELF